MSPNTTLLLVALIVIGAIWVITVYTQRPHHPERFGFMTPSTFLRLIKGNNIATRICVSTIVNSNSTSVSKKMTTTPNSDDLIVKTSDSNAIVGASRDRAIMYHYRSCFHKKLHHKYDVTLKMI